MQALQNMVITFLGLLHQTVVLVVEGLAEVQIYQLERAHFSSSRTTAIAFIVIEKVLVGAVLLPRCFGRL